MEGDYRDAVVIEYIVTYTRNKDLVLKAGMETVDRGI